MTGKERVRRALRFEEPDRIPWQWFKEPGDMTTELAKTATEDFTARPDDELRRLVPDFPGTLTDTEWGCIRDRLHEGPSTVETVRSAWQEWDEFDDFKIPDIDAEYRYRDAAEFARQDDTGRYGLAWFGSFYFGTLYNIRKMEDLLVDLGLYQEELKRFCARIEPVFLRCLDRWHEVGADGILYGDDLGVQDRLFMRPVVWRDIFLPFYRRFFEHAHELGIDVWMHSCGYIRDIMPDLVDAGLDAFQFDQICIYDLDDLEQTFGERVSFFCPPDIQTVLPTGDRDRIRAHCRELCLKLGSRGGGFIAKDYPGWEVLGVDDKWVDWYHRDFAEFGQY